MAITLNSGRQYPLAAVLEFTFADQAVPIADAPAIELPANAVVTGGYVEVTTAYVGLGASATIDLQIDNVSLLAAAVDLDVAAGTGAAIVPNGAKMAATNTVDVTIAGTGTATAGAVRVIIEYIIVGRANENQG